jgi:phage baseplate assembly protein W
MASKHFERAISLPFSIDSYGNVASTKDQSKIWADKVRSVIGTNVGERIMRAEFGTKVPFATFNGQQIVAEITRREIFAAFAKNLPALSLQNVSVSFGDEDQVIAEVTYSLPNQQEVTTTIGLAYISGNSPIYEEFL